MAVARGRIGKVPRQFCPCWAWSGWLTLLMSAVSWSIEPYLYVVAPDLGSADDYIVAYDATGAVAQQSLVDGRIYSLGLRTDGQYLIAGHSTTGVDFARLTELTTTGSPVLAISPVVPSVFYFDIDSAGNSCVTYTGEDLDCFRPDGSIYWRNPEGGSTGLALVGAHQLYASGDHWLRRYNTMTGEREIDLTIAVPFPGDLAVDPADSILYMASQPGGVVAFDISGASPTVVRHLATPGLSVVLDITVDYFSGHVFAAGFGGVVELDPLGQLVKSYHDPFHVANAVLPRSDLARSDDFDRDHDLDLHDLDSLVEAIAQGNTDRQYDVTRDGQLDQNDITQWLIDAGAVYQALDGPYLAGDANLDGFVDGHDAAIWNRYKFSQQSAWSRGDFNADGFVDGSDYAIWNENKFQPQSNLVPEPNKLCLLILSLVFLCVRERFHLQSPRGR